MLKIVVPATEKFDESRNEFITIKEHTLCLEHSLVSLSKWESKWCKPFLSTDERTDEETIDYIKCMTLSQNVDENVYRCLTYRNVEDIRAYINHPMTATWITDLDKKPKSREIITSEIIYYWMISLNIPFECQKWHLNRLLMLIRVCDEKNKPPKKMSKRDLAERNRALNEARRAAAKSNG